MHSPGQGLGDLGSGFIPYIIGANPTRTGQTIPSANYSAFANGRQKNWTLRYALSPPSSSPSIAGSSRRSALYGAFRCEGLRPLVALPLNEAEALGKYGQTRRQIDWVVSVTMACGLAGAEP